MSRPVKFATAEDAYKALKLARESGTAKSLLAKHLTDEIFEKLKDKKTSNGTTFLDVIESGCINPYRMMGMHAPDVEAYDVFSDIYTPMILDYHGLKSPADMKQPEFDMGDIKRLYNIDPEGEYIISTRCRVARTVKDLPLNSRMTEDDYRKLEQMIKNATAKFSGDMAGDYISLSEMSKEQQNKLVEDHYLFGDYNKFLEDANAVNFWPTGRGIFLNKDKTFLIWCGEEDHIRVISMQKGADIGQVVSRLSRALAEFSANFDLARHPQLGFLAFCPTNIGTTMRASFLIKLPKLGADMKKLREVAAEHNLQIRGLNGYDKGLSSEPIFDISNLRRLGYPEYALIDDMHKGCEALIKLEKSLE